MARPRSELAIFELPVVLLPGELMALHIFEERYKRMVGDSLERDEPFGIVFRDPEKDRPTDVGCEARVSEVLERFEDGRMNIVVTGERPFRVLDRYESPRFPAGEVEPAGDRGGGEIKPDGEGAEHAQAVRAAFSEFVRRVGGEEPDPAELESAGAYEIAARVELPPETKQRLLELRDEGERMRVLAAALEALVGALERSEELAARARMNGKLIVGR